MSGYPMNITCTQLSSQMLQCGNEKYTIGDHLDYTDSTQFFVDIGVVCALVLFAGLMSGLTMGLMSMDKLNLKILANGNDPKSKKYASKILPLVERHHLLLVTLLLSNAACAEALPIFLDRLVHPAIAIVLSVTLVLMFGEIIPQAVCTRYGLKIGAYLSWFVWFMIVILCPVAWPIAKLLDILLGKDTGTFFRRAELKELVHLHAEDALHAPEGESLTIDEVRIIKGAIDMKEKTVKQAYTPIEKVFAIDINSTLTRDVLQKIVDSGHDRIPIFHLTRDHFIGMILVKDLILIDPNANVPVRDIKMYRVPMVGSDMQLYDMLHQFQSDMSIVLDYNDHITPEGIITLEDVMEELLQEEIYDEDDVRRQNASVSELGGIAHDVRLAKAFLPRKYSLATQQALNMSTERKMSTAMPPGATNPPSLNTQQIMDLHRRPTTAGIPSLPPTISHAINSPTARHASQPFHHRSLSHPVNVISYANAPPHYHPRPPLPPNAPNPNNLSSSTNNINNTDTNNNNNTNEQTPLLPPSGKPSN